MKLSLLDSIRYSHDVIAAHFSMQVTGARGNASDWLAGYTCKLPTGHAIFGSRLKLICRRQVALHISRLVFLDDFLEVVLDSFL